MQYSIHVTKCDSNIRVTDLSITPEIIISFCGDHLNFPLFSILKYMVSHY